MSQGGIEGACYKLQLVRLIASPHRLRCHESTQLMLVGLAGYDVVLNEHFSIRAPPLVLLSGLQW